MQVPKHIFREYDIRGIADTELTEKTVTAIGKAYGTFLYREGITSITVGGDVRLSTDRIKKNVIDGVTWAGIHVTDIGVATSPLLYWSQFRFNFDGGIMVTGSHNPKDMNGLKLAYGKSTMYGEQIQLILSMIEKDDFEKGPAPGTIKKANIWEEYIAMLLSKIKLGPRKLKVAADAGNGTAGLYIQTFLEKLGCEVVPLFCEPDGTFPNHHPDPLKRENLTFLIEKVRQEKADLGIAFDGDADRIGVVDEKGTVIWGDTLMGLYWREILPKYPGAVAIIEVKCSQALEDEILRLGGKPLYYKAGHSLIKAKMKEVDALFAGELSGHMFFADEFYGFDDSFYAAGRLLRILSNDARSLSEMLVDYPVYYSTAEIRVDCPDEKKFQVIEKIKEEALKDHDAITIDGVRILYDRRGWGLVRASNTQPVLVTRCEGKTQEDLDHITRDMKQRMLDVGIPDFEWTY
ncbi:MULTISPECIES: phosphomannomutase/phosphoglucomutase [Aminobacterium]|jgi:phosphomannomutase/phosphoglucomutase|uniref:Phosphomannomutase n=1 Tax=Aminobacterium colombiense (strain DSM 12261 / ALA-1) TaxID=572547 RepID=D5EDC9_AMICL|nr:MULTISPECIES: phosphomannomutase/phosphoglucomutase [Aminobacterium]MDD2379082.1 phosphomannomutase/phosphoglucomutase [Aminobacterium colombiense]ADE56561.1 Phosphomannomutase [Aminobacterium colombiense DSM 12261]MDD3768362.1 phosphomannomutase/phosphoglucomutase [Aminobacterium colombiense]MDD4265232.1 phosphomannomutase/phosphoglucomutase [Aminobacterium colombiense]MDD4585763.1 phosphomannomutase/phosphoglucomutase [Aminobacterium colombiense]